jgi:(p)ppGpp synthase/HD superfamily hydrolase
MPNIPISEKEKLAWDFAKEKHHGQVRQFIGQPYFDAHVQKVNGIVKQYTTDEDMLCVALLHDVIEDCYDYNEKWTGYKDIKNLFGKRVSDLVLELTSDDNEKKHRYDGNKTAYLTHKMLHMTEDALVIKLSDRLQNISDAFTASEKFRNKYFQETSSIVDSIESGRELNDIHKRLLDDIKSKLGNVSSMFKIKKFGDI